MAGRVRERDLGMKKILRTLKAGNDYRTKVGIQGTQGDAIRDGISNAQLGAVHEFGVPGRIPERSYMRSTFDALQKFYLAILVRDLRLIGLSSGSVRMTLDRLGERHLGDIVRRINAGIPPPNAQVTIDRKGSSKPLIDTAQLKQSLTVKTAKARRGA